ncbi:MAG TPA: hypothetical protein VFA68_13070 [Terriglobales bacterium]|nr:hypothetical protein [Terriglobales bacterium]
MTLFHKLVGNVSSARNKIRAVAILSLCLGLGNQAVGQSCPIESAAIEDAKPNKLYLYFPTADDASFPNYATNVSPLKAFDIANLGDYTGTTSDLEDQVTNVVIDDYCEFNVKVLQTTAVPPTTFPRRVTVGIGTDSVGSFATGVLFGQAQEVDTGDPIVVDFARVWAGSYETEAGGSGSGALSGGNSTLQRWAFSIGGTAAHEAGHTYGLAHADDFGTNADGCNPPDHTKPGEDPVFRHIMPAGCNISDEQRAGFRRHFSDATYGILASNVGLSVETVHNWDYTNPNSASASQLQLEILSTSMTLTPSWTYLGNLSPWTTPSVSSIGTTVFKGTNFNRFRVTFSNGQAWANGSPGIVPGGAAFHVGVAFSEADFSVPDSVIVVKVTLTDGSGTPLTLQPRMVAYDTGALDASDGFYRLNFFNADNLARPLILRDLVVSALPKVASIDSMLRGLAPQTRQGEKIAPWRSERPLCKENTGRAASEGCPVTLNDQTLTIVAGRLAQGRNVVQVQDGKCAGVVKRGGADSVKPPDVNNCPNAGVNIDLFPATTLYITATVVDPNAKHWDPATKSFVTGPLESHLFYQIAGRHPDLNRNGIDDFVEILQAKSKDDNKDGVPDEAQHCLKRLRELDSCEAKEGDQQRSLAALERQELGIADCERRCQGKPGEESCDHQCEEGREKLDHREHELDEQVHHQGHECREALRSFRHCEEEFNESKGAGSLRESVGDSGNVVAMR